MKKLNYFHGLVGVLFNLSMPGVKFINSSLNLLFFCLLCTFARIILKDLVNKKTNTLSRWISTEGGPIQQEEVCIHATEYFQPSVGLSSLAFSAQQWLKYSGQSLSFHDNFQKISTWCFYCHCLVNMLWPTLFLFLWKAGYKGNKINRYLHWIQKRGLALPYLYSVVTWFTIISKWCMFCGGILRHGNPSIFWTSLRSLYARQKEWKVY